VLQEDQVRIIFYFPHPNTYSPFPGWEISKSRLNSSCYQRRYMECQDVKGMYTSIINVSSLLFLFSFFL
jgi:hypothetical protein